MSKILAWFLLSMQFLLPKHLLTTAVYHIARIRNEPLKNFLIRRFVATYHIDTAEAERPVPDGYVSLNDFFTRSLADGARPIDKSNTSIISPVDGTISACGTIEANLIFQAKGKKYSLHDLLLTDVQDADRFLNGMFATFYLAPHDYHRVHLPLDARLLAARYVPGSLYSVNDASVSLLPGLFTRNERLLCYFDSDAGLFVLILVGALHVGSISTPWTGEIRPRRKGTVQDIDIAKSEIPLSAQKGDLVGTFNMGSTVIVLFAQHTVAFDAALVAGGKATMGQAIGHLVRGANE